MGTLINPASKIIGHKKQIFWGHNFSFNFTPHVYKQKIFQIKTFKRLFKYLLRYLARFFNIPRVYYSISLNFIGQANTILDIKLYIHRIFGYNMAALLLSFNSLDLIQVRPTYRRYRKRLKSRLHRGLNLHQIRYCRIFLKWRKLLLNLLFKRLDKTKRVYKKNMVKDYAKHLRSIRKRKLKKLMRFCSYFAISKSSKKYLRENLKMKYFRHYFVCKFRFLRVNLRLYKSFNTKFFMDLIIFIFNSCITRIANNFNITKIKLNFRNKKVQPATMVRSFNNFCYLALRRGYRINYIIKIIRITVRYLKRIRGFKMIVSGRFYRRGRAMFRVSQWGEVGSQTGKNYLIYRNSERVKEYGMCSVKLLFFFRRIFKLFPKIPLRSKWYNFLKYLRFNYKIRQHFGYIRY